MTFCTMSAVAVKAAVAIAKPQSMWDFGNQRYTAYGHGSFDSTGDFYRSLGIEYRALDINNEMEADIVDLNHRVSLPERDLVVNNGTSEHLFNQAAVFENAHNLSRDGMLHMVPFSPWWNHGFFNYNPNLFRDLAATNDYSVEFQWIGNRDGEYVDITGKDFGYNGKRWVDLAEHIKPVPPKTGYFVITFLRKRSNAAFRYPMQGRYMADLASEELKRAYARG